jgi:membrane protease YdiL (CAAX protease family)
MGSFREMIRRLTPGIEFLIVVVWAFGQLVFSSILSVGTPAQYAATNETLVSFVVVLGVQFAFLVWFLRVRGWTLQKTGLSVTLRATLLGIGLAVATVAVLVAANAIAPLLLLSAPAPTHAAAHVDLQIVLLVVVVTGIYEEAFAAGYVITAASSHRGPWAAINMSTGIRLLCHLYQGPIAVVTTVPLGLLYGYAYVRSRQLWPLFVARVAVDGGMVLYAMAAAS